MVKLIKFCALLVLASLVACGGGGGSGGSNPNQSAFFTTAGSTVTLPVASAGQYEVGGGVPPYRIGNTDTTIAVGAINGKVLTIGAVAAGTSPITIFDNAGASITVSVRVGSSIPLYTTASSSVVIGVGSSASRIFSIGGGGGSYTVEGSANAVAKVEMVGATQWKVTGITIGTTDVKIRDAAGTIVQVSVTVGAPELRVSPTTLKLFPGIRAIVKISGGQPPYRIAGGIPAAVDAMISTTNPDELIITGKLASTLELSVADATGQLQKVTVTVEIGQGTFGFSPNALSVSENDNQPISLTIFGAAPGKLCLFTSDSTFLKPAGDSCKTVVSGETQITIETGTLGTRCVSANTPVTITAVDANRSVGTATITIIDNGLNGPDCGVAAFAIAPAALTLTATSTVGQAVITGGSGTYTAVTSNSAAATASVAGSVITVTRVAAALTNPVVITVRDSKDPSRALTLNVTVN